MNFGAKLYMRTPEESAKTIEMPNACEKKQIKKALQMFINRDRYELLRTNIFEPTINHRIAVYLEGLFPDFNVDCEYNKQADKFLNQKIIFVGKNAKSKKVRPDIIIHKRNLENNYIVFEIKKSGVNSKSARTDIKKVENYIIGDLNYTLGVFIGILKRKIDVCWVEKDSNKQLIKSREVLK